jgi:hypothetical protein
MQDGAASDADPASMQHADVDIEINDAGKPS